MWLPLPFSLPWLTALPPPLRRDFDPYDLRMKLPKAVTRLAREHDPAKGTAYIHCTAGMGRAPATAVAYMAWIRGIPVDEAYEMMTTVRRCR